MDNPQGDQPVFAVYHGYEYLEEETSAMQRLVDSGSNLVPDEFVVPVHEPWLHSQSVSRPEETLLETIKDDDRSVIEAEQAMVEAQASQIYAQTDQERAGLSERLTKLEAEKAKLANRLAESEQQLDAQSSGAIRYIKTEEHRPLLLDAVEKVTSELTLVSAWIRPNAFDDELRCKLAECDKPWRNSTDCLGAWNKLESQDAGAKARGGSD